MEGIISVFLVLESMMLIWVVIEMCSLLLGLGRFSRLL